MRVEDRGIEWKREAEREEERGIGRKREEEIGGNMKG